jgi:hypothetical protein
MTTTKNPLALAPFAALLFAACASNELGPGPDGGAPPPAQNEHLQLVIVGDRSVLLNNGASKELVVKYVNDAGQPRAGTISLSFSGDGKGATLSPMSGVTQTDGSVHATLVGGASGNANFNVVASAPEAASVNWNVAVSTNQPPTPAPLQVIGTYKLESTFNAVEGLTGTAATVVTDFIGISEDPAGWLLTQWANSDAGVAATINSFRAPLAAALDGLLESLTTFTVDNTKVDVLKILMTFGTGFDSVVHKFGIKSSLQIYAGPNNTLLGKHTVTGFFFTIDGKRVDKSTAELGMDTIEVDKVPITLMGESQITIGNHSFGMKDGGLIVFAINNVLISSLDPNANNLADFLGDIIPCDSFADWMDQNVLDSYATWNSLCTTAIKFGGVYLEGKLADLGDGAATFQINGTVRPEDTDGDRKVDTLVNGQWQGQIMYGATPSPLTPRDCPFHSVK